MLATVLTAMGITDGDRDTKCSCLLPNYLLNRLIGIQIGAGRQKCADFGNQKMVALTLSRDANSFQTLSRISARGRSVAFSSQMITD